VGEDSFAYEAVPDRIRRRPVRQFVEEYEYVVVLTHHLFREENSTAKADLTRFLARQKGRYGIWAALRAAIQGGMLAPIADRRRLPYRSTAPTCSGFVRLALAACGVWDFGPNADLTTPSDIANTACFAVRGILSGRWPIAPHPEDSTFSLCDVRDDLCP
jgi:hypothetical protein